MAAEAETVLIRKAAPGDWPKMWRFMREIIAAGETYCWDPGIGEDEARALWCQPEGKPGGTVVAVDGEGAVLGTAEYCPNQGRNGAHVANASFMVDPRHGGRGVGRALAQDVITRARADGFRAMQFNAVVETNAAAVHLWRSLGFEVLATVPEAFRHPARGYVGLHIMHRRL